MEGQIVCSRAGHDKGLYMVVVGCEEDRLLVCDGKEHPLSRPKRKNRKHLCDTGSFLTKEQYITDKSLRRALAVHRCAAEALKEEKICQKRI